MKREEEDEDEAREEENEDEDEERGEKNYKKGINDFCTYELRSYASARRLERHVSVLRVKKNPTYAASGVLNVTF